MEHYWEVLGLRETATAAELRVRYRHLVKAWHPDKFASNSRLQAEAEARLKRINEAYRALAAECRRSTVANTAENEAPRVSAAWLQSEPLLSYLPLVLLALVVAEQKFNVFIPATPVAAALLAPAWAIMAQRVWQNAALSKEARIGWIVLMVAFAGVAVPIYFARHVTHRRPPP